MRRWLKRRTIGILAAIVLLAALCFIVPYATTGTSRESEFDTPTASDRPTPREKDVVDKPLGVMTANIAHGRGTGFHQALIGADKVRSNLDAIAKIINGHRPDVVALQEADGPSLWSGTFNHVDYLAEASKLAHRFRGEHVRGWKTSYGTALLSQRTLEDCDAVTFAPSPPTLSKGYVVGQVPWPANPSIRVSVVSVHLDFSRSSVRQKQVDTMIEKLSGRAGPLIVMGDFNCSWSDNETSSLRRLTEKLALSAYRPTAEDLATFPQTARRLDWILISSELEFVRYETLPDRVSDHYAVFASLKLRRDR